MKRTALISLCVFASLRLLAAPKLGIGGCGGADLNAAKLADAIYRAEGGARAKAPYGILSVRVNGQAEARRVCLRTIAHAWRDYQLGTRNPKLETFIPFLADRYCPPSVDRVGNRNWKRNVTLLCR